MGLVDVSAPILDAIALTAKLSRVSRHGWDRAFQICTEGSVEHVMTLVLPWDKRPHLYNHFTSVGLWRWRETLPKWTLPSLIDQNSLIWMLEVNGLIIDIRHAPRALQEEAFQKGLIPYIPNV